MHSLWSLAQDLRSPAYTWIDLSYELSPQTPHWHGFGEMSTRAIYTFGPTCCFHADNYFLPSGQLGTHVDAPSHFHKGARSLDQIQLQEMVYPLVVIDKSLACKKNADYELTIDDLLDWEKVYGTIPDNAFVAFRSDWSMRDDLHNYDAFGQPHYPGWSLQALQWLVTERRIGAIGHETADTDAPAANTNNASETYFLGTGKIQVELLTNLHQVPPAGAIIFATFPKVKKGTGFPARVFAIFPTQSPKF